MDFDEWREKWFQACRDQGHTLIMDGDGIDQFVTAWGYHNGPGCSVCDWSTCMHCKPMDRIPKCTGVPENPSMAGYIP